MKSVVVGTAGHIDHGKSALVRALTGTDPDRLQEEKARGITIDLGFAHLALPASAGGDTGEVNYAFVDVPGHERFVRNMLAGVGGIDLVVLVVAADESVMPQTREHFDICRLLRVPAGVVALTKADLVDADTIELVRLEVRELLAGSFLDGAPMIPVSSRTGAGLDQLRSALAEAGARARGRSATGPIRLPIDRVFSMKGFGTVATGTLVSGRLRVDDELTIEPGGRRVKVRGVQVHGAKQAEAVAGQRTAANLAGVDVGDVSRGQALVTPDAFVPTRAVDAVVELLPGARPLKHGARVRLHQGTAEVLGRVAVAGPAASAIEPGARAYVRIRLEREAVLARGDRYILRAYSPPTTIAGGHVLDPHPPRSAIRTEAALARIGRLDFDPAQPALRDAADDRAAAVMIEDAGAAGLPMRALVWRAAVAPEALDAFVDRLVAGSLAYRAGDVLVQPAVVQALERTIGDLLGAHHRAEPLSEGLPREEVRERLFGRGAPAVFERVVEHLVKRGVLAGRDRLALASHRLALSPEEEQARAAIEQLFLSGGLKPPDPATLATDARVPSAVADRVLKLMQRQRVLVRIDTLWFHEAALKQLKADVAAMKAAGGAGVRIDVGTFKERYGVTRKFAIPLLEYLDRERVTRRVGDARVVL